MTSFWFSDCATRGHIATPDEMALLERSAGLSASGRITLKGLRGRLSTAVVFGVARPDSLRIEIPAGTGLRFLLISKEGRLRADLPQDDAMFEGPATAEVMERLFGIELDPKTLVGAVLGSPPEHFQLNWRFDSTLPAQVTIHNPRGATLSLTLKDPEIEAPAARAFEFGPPRGRVWTLEEMASRLGLTR
jgi:hypothetical protein